ncbi:hypothetical protein NL676_038508 [Syzygium grande]|nr:hypothetical protein NL676_038508 [Syzygium grande]
MGCCRSRSSCIRPRSSSPNLPPCSHPSILTIVERIYQWVVGVYVGIVVVGAGGVIFASDSGVELANPSRAGRRFRVKSRVIVCERGRGQERELSSVGGGRGASATFLWEGGGRAPEESQRGEMGTGVWGGGGDGGGAGG